MVLKRKNYAIVGLLICYIVKNYDIYLISIWDVDSLKSLVFYVVELLLQIVHVLVFFYLLYLIKF